MATTTSNFGFNLPTVGADRDAWGSYLNQNFAALDNLLLYAMPIGAVLDFAAPNPPPGWLFCDGRLLSRTTYSALFAVIGTYFGAGDGSTTFALPPTTGRMTVCVGTVIDDNGVSRTFSFAQRMGSGGVPITQSNLPALSLTTSTIAAHSHGGATASAAHSHNLGYAGGHTHTEELAGNHQHGGQSDLIGAHTHPIHLPIAGHVSAGGAGSPGASDGIYTTDAAGDHQHNITTDVQGLHTHTIDGVGDHIHSINSTAISLGIYPDGSHSHTLSLGGLGTWLPVLNPSLAMSKIIFAGQQAVALALALSAPAPARRRLAAPMRGSR